MVRWMQRLRDQQDRLWIKCCVVKRGRWSCWEFMGATDKDGYGKFTITAPTGHVPKQKHIRAHQAAFALKMGRMPRHGELVLHKCDNPLCCNPSHLESGDNLTNRHQRMRRRGD